MSVVVGDMKVEFVANAGFVVTLADGRTLVTDPWLSGGAYYGSWYNYPPVPEDEVARLRELEPDWVYVSHLHPDHLDPATLRWFAASPMVIGDLGHAHLRRSIAATGATNIVELPLDATSDMGGGVEFTILSQFAAADAGFEDDVGYAIDTSLAVRDRDGTLLLDVADNPMSVEDAADVVQRFGRPDIAIVPYSGASLYPHAFCYTPEDKDARAEALRQRTVNAFLDRSEVLQAPVTVPAAGSYVMGGAIAGYTRWLHQATPQQLRDAWDDRQLDDVSSLVYMAPGQVLESDADPTHHQSLVEFTPDDRLGYARSLATRPLAHEDVNIPAQFPMPWNRLLTKARSNLWAVQTARSLFPAIDVEIRLPASKQVSCDGIVFRWPMNANTTGARNADYVAFTIDPALLLMALTGAAIWNNIEIGALVQIERSPDDYNPTVHSLMSYFTL